MPSARVMGASATEQHRADNAAPIIGAAKTASFPAMLSNAAATSDTAPASAAAAGQPPAHRSGGGGASVASPLAVTPKPAGREAQSNGRDVAASRPSGPPPPEPGHRSRRSDASSLAAPGHGPHHVPVAACGLTAGTALYDPDAAKEPGGLSYRTQIDSRAATVPSAPKSDKHHIPPSQENPEALALSAASLIAGDVPRSEPRGAAAPPAAIGSEVGEGSAAGTTGGRERPLPMMGEATGAAHKPDIAATAQAGGDPARQQATPEAADSGASILLNPAPAAVPDARSTTSGPARIDPKLGDVALAAARKAMPGDGLAIAELQPLPDRGDGAAKESPLAAAAAGAAVASPAPAAPALGNSSNISAVNPSQPSIPDQVMGHLLRSIQDPDHEVVLHLQPSELGDLTVRVAVSGREVSAWFATPQSQVQQAISQAIGQLHTDLGNAGYNLSGVWVGADASDPRERNGRLPSPQPRHAPAHGERVTAPAAALAASAGSGVSVYV